MGTIFLLGGAAVAWGVFVPLDGAVVTQGALIVDGNVKKVQHQTGGIIGALLVRDGARVGEGDVVARLDDTQTRASLGVVQAELTGQQARAARLMAERDDLEDVSFPPALLKRAAHDPETRAALDNEVQVFRSRRTARDGQRSQLRERLTQASQDIQGLSRQLEATREQLAIATREYDNLEPLRKDGLIQRPRLAALEREIARNEGIVGDASARIASATSRQREVEVQIAQIDRDRAAEATKELRDVEARIAELNERRMAAEDTLRKADIRAPSAGMVHELAVHTVGGVVNPGETLMSIVPDPDSMVIEARVLPNDIDQVHLDQPARVRFTAFNQRKLPDLVGKVVRISPTSSRDPQTGQTFFTIAVRLEPGEVARIGPGSRLVPGMLADVYVTTTPRTVVSFLFQPLLDNYEKAFAGR